MGHQLLGHLGPKQVMRKPTRLGNQGLIRQGDSMAIRIAG